MIVLIDIVRTRWPIREDEVKKQKHL